MNLIKENGSVVLWGLTTAFILYCVHRYQPVGFPFVPDIGAKLPSLLGSLLLVSLFVERVIEVFVSIWRDPRTDQLEQQLSNFQDTQARRRQEIAELVKELAEGNPSDARKTEIAHVLEGKRESLDQAEKGEDKAKTDLVPLSARTRRVSTWVGMTIGVLASAVGFRFFEQIVSLDAIRTGHPHHLQWFTFTDVLLTGTVLAGGSKVIHSIFSVYDSFMVSKKNRSVPTMPDTARS